MPTRLICTEGLSIDLGGSGSRTLVVARDGGAVRFWCDTAEMEAVLEGRPIHLAVLDDICTVAPEGTWVRFEFRDGRGKLRDGLCSLDELQARLRSIRESTAHLPDAREAKSPLIVEASLV
jgi:hypothetical protein